MEKIGGDMPRRSKMTALWLVGCALQLGRGEEVSSAPLRAWLVAAGLCLQLLGLPAQAQGSVALLDEARRLLAAGRAEQAAGLLDKELLNFAGIAEYDALLGQALYQTGRHGEALFAFERVLMADPGNIEARLKAAELSAEQGNATLGHEMLAPLVGQSLAPPQQQALERINDALAAKAGEGALQGYVLAGFGWDSNVTGGPDQRLLVIPVLGTAPTDIGDAARAHDVAGMVEAGLTLRKPIAENTWLIGSGSVRQSFYASRKASQEGIANVDVGVATGTESNLFGASVLGQDYTVGGALYRQSLGGRLNWAHTFENRTHLSSYFQYVDFDYPVHALDSSIRRVVGVSSDYTSPGGTWVLQYGAYGGVDYAKDPSRPHFSYRLWGLQVGGNLSLNDRLSLSFGAIYEPHEYLAEEALYQAWRRDSMRSLGVSADYRIGGSWHLMPQYTYTYNASTLELFDYSRSTFMLQVKWEFSK